MALMFKLGRGLPANYKSKMEEKGLAVIALTEKARALGVDLAEYEAYHDDVKPLFELLKSTYEHVDDGLSLKLPGIQLDDSESGVEAHIVRAREITLGTIALVKVLVDQVSSLELEVKALNSANSALLSGKGKMKQNVDAPRSLTEHIMSFERSDDNNLTGTVAMRSPRARQEEIVSPPPITHPQFG